MLIFNHVPRAFRVRSSQPDLIIQYVCSPFVRVLLLLLMSPFVALFLGHCAILLFALKSLLTFNLGEFFNTLSYSRGNPLYILVFSFTFVLLGAISWYGPDSALTVTELKAKQEEIVLTYKTLWRFREVSIPADSISYFHQRSRRDGTSGDRWVLEVVTNRRLSDNVHSLPSWLPDKWNSEAWRTRLNYRIVQLFSAHNQTPASWLGEVLAAFYKVELR